MKFFLLPQADPANLIDQHRHLDDVDVLPRVSGCALGPGTATGSGADQSIGGGAVHQRWFCADERAGMSERQIFERTKAVFEYFNLPFDVQG